ncbi:MAG TPA: helix-turn-helix domain-containing protein [Bacteroidales bacterium]|nr:helix-turn-helix domain-containing protein [Bacteroidales bacterium]
MLKDLMVFLEFHSKWFFAILVYQNFLLFIIMFYYGKWASSRPKLILSQFFLISGIIFLAFLFQHTGRIQMAGKLNFLLPGGFFLIMPFAYFYLRSLANKKYDSWVWILFHFIPAAILLIVNFVLIFTRHSPTISLMNIPHNSMAVIIILQVVLWGQFLFYTIQIVKYLWKTGCLSFRKISFSLAAQAKWQLLLFVAFGAYSIIMVFMIMDSMVYKKETNDIILYIIAFITISIVIGLFAFKYQELPDGVTVVYDDSGEIVYTNSEIANVQITAKKSSDENETKTKSQLTPERREELLARFNQLIEEKIYLNVDFNLSSLAKSMNSNSKYVSEVVNVSTGKTFSQYIRELRIDEAKKLIEEKNTELYSIEGISRIVGYNSKSSFNSHFKELTGMTPSEYLQRIKEV